MAEIRFSEVARMIQENFHEQDIVKVRHCQDAVFNILKAVYGEPLGHVFEGDEEVLDAIITNVCRTFENGVMEARDRCIIEARNNKDADSEWLVRKAVVPLY